jgi:hypothetical protein
VLLFFSFFSLFSQEKLRVSEINLSGNNITNDEIIYRELLFEIGDQILVDQLPDLIEKSTNNLLNTSLFNFVTITHSITRSSLKIEIVFQERWYIWPYPVLEHADRNLSSYLNNEEWSRIDYGLFVLINNFRGRKEILKLKTIFGFNNRYGLTYYKPFIDKKQKVGFGLDLNYYQNREVAFQINNNELDYIKSGNDYVRETLEFTGFITYRPQMYTNHLIAIKYDDVSVYDTVVKLNDNYFFNHENKINLFSLIYNFDFDKRDSKIYPLTGFRFFTAIAKKGIGIASDKGPFYVKSIAEENLKLSNRFYFNTSVGWKYSFNNINSFYFSKAIGYDNYIRGMEYYVSNGCHYYVSKSNFKFELIPQTNLNLNFLSSNKFSKAHYAFYINLFFDTGYVDSNYNIHTSLSNEFLYSGGVGLDFVTYYDKVLRIEYSLNKFGEHGLFFHLGAPIIE